MRYIVRNAAGQIINAIELEDGAVWSPPTGCTIERSDANIQGPATKSRAQLLRERFAQQTPKEKLARLGLTPEDLKAILTEPAPSDTVK